MWNVEPWNLRVYIPPLFICSTFKQPKLKRGDDRFCHARFRTLVLGELIMQGDAGEHIECNRCKKLEQKLADSTTKNAVYRSVGRKGNRYCVERGMGERAAFSQR